MNRYRFVASIEMDILAENEHEAQDKATQMSNDIDSLMLEGFGPDSDSICGIPELIRRES